MSPADLENQRAAVESVKREAAAVLRSALLEGRCTSAARAQLLKATAALDALRARSLELANQVEADRQAEHRAKGAEIVRGAMRRLQLLLEEVAMPQPPKSLSITEKP